MTPSLSPCNAADIAGYTERGNGFHLRYCYFLSNVKFNTDRALFIFETVKAKIWNCTEDKSRTRENKNIRRKCTLFFCPMEQRALVGQGPLRTSNQPVAETFTWHHTTLTRDKLPCPQRESNQKSQQANGRRPTSQTARLWVYSS